MCLLLGEMRMGHKKERTDLLIEAHRINYRLRSTFFYNKLNEYHTYEFPETIQKLVPLENNFDWAEFQKWGITKDAFDEIKKTTLSLLQVFCHQALRVLLVLPGSRCFP